MSLENYTYVYLDISALQPKLIENSDSKLGNYKWLR